MRSFIASFCINTSGLLDSNQSSVFWLESLHSLSTMKLPALILLALLGAAHGSLSDDFQEFIALIPVNEIKTISKEYIANDAQVQQVVAWLKGAEFQSILATVHATPEWIEFVEFLDDCGVNIYSAIERVYELLGLESSFGRRAVSSRVLSKGFHDWATDVLALIPFDDLKALAKEKVQTSSDFQEFWARIQSDDFKTIATNLSANEAWQALLQKGRDHGAPVDEWIAVIYDFFGWNQ